jgi:hypothetical protein
MEMEARLSKLLVLSGLVFVISGTNSLEAPLVVLSMP